MFIDLSASIHEALHNLVNLYLIPDCLLRLGQSDRCSFRGADVVMERTGNLYSSGRDAVTYRYNMVGSGFNACLLVIWRDPDEATASVHVLALTPDHNDTREALEEWLASVVNGRMPPRNLFGGTELH